MNNGLFKPGGDIGDDAKQRYVTVCNATLFVLHPFLQSSENTTEVTAKLHDLFTATETHVTSHNATLYAALSIRGVSTDQRIAMEFVKAVALVW